MRAQRRMENNTKVSIPMSGGTVKNIAEDSDGSDHLEDGGKLKDLRNYNASVRKQFNNRSF